MELTQKLSRQEQEALEMMSDGEGELARIHDSEEYEIIKEWDPDKAEKMTQKGIFKDDSINEVDPVQRSLVEAYRISKKVGLEFEEAKQLIKEFVFNMKKLEEENLRRENIERRRKRKKEFKRLVRKLSEDPFDPDLKWEQDEKTPGETRLDQLFPKSKRVLDMDDEAEEVVRKYMDMKDRKMRGEIDGEELVELQKETNVRKFLEDFFLTSQAKLGYCTRETPIEIDEILSHHGTKTLFLFWHFLDKGLERAGDDSEERAQELQAFVNQVTVRLNRFSGYLRGLMFRSIGGKKPPRIIFLKSKRQEFLDQHEREFRKVFPDLIRERVTQSRDDFVGELRTEDEVEAYVARNIDKFVGMTVLKYGELYTNHVILGDIKKNFGSIEGYIQRIQEGGHLPSPGAKQQKSKVTKSERKRKTKQDRVEKLWKGPQ